MSHSMLHSLSKSTTHLATKISLMLNYRMTEHNISATLLATGYVREVIWIGEWKQFSRKKSFGTFLIMQLLILYSVVC